MEKCICNINGHPIKDSIARKEIEELKKNSGGGTQLFEHCITGFEITSNSISPFTHIKVVNTRSTPYTTLFELLRDNGFVNYELGFPNGFGVLIYGKTYQWSDPVDKFYSVPCFDGSYIEELTQDVNILSYTPTKL